MEQEYKEEIWKDVGVYDGVDFTGCYEVSNKGGVRALNRIIMRKNGRKQIKDGHIMRQYDDGHGYMKVFLKKNGKMKSPKVHQLVALRFIPNPDPEHKTQVNHIDEDKTNNCAAYTIGHIMNKQDYIYKNYFWIRLDKYNDLAKENLMELISEKVTIKETKLHKSSNKPIMQFSKNGEFIREYPSIVNAAKEIGYTKQAIQQCVSGKCETCKGYKWKYK